MNDVPTLEELLVRHREVLVRYLGRRGSGLLKFEAAEDLAQAVHMKAVQAEGRFDYRGEEAFIGWICTLGRQHIADRNAYWKAQKRNAGPMLRITYGGATSSGGAKGVSPAAEQQGPTTFAGVREQVEVAARAIATLPPRDAQIVELIRAGADVEDVARELRVSYAAAQRARLRSIERFKKAFELLSRTA